MGTLTVNAGGVIDSPNSSFAVGTVTLEPQTGVPNPGLITTSLIPTNAVGSMTFTSTKGNLSFVGGAGKAFGILGASADLTITAGGNITFSPQITYLGSNNETVDSTAKSGIVSLASNTLSVLPSAAGNGGTLNLTASALQVDGKAPTTNLTFNAAAAGTGGNGGVINVTLTGKGNATIDATPTDAGALNFIANGVGTGNGGSVSLTNSNGLIIWTVANGGINIAPNLATGGNGGNLSLSTGTGFNITGAIGGVGTTPPGGAAGASWGNVTLDVTSGKTALNIDNGVIGTNFISSTVTGANVTIQDAGGITIGGPNAITIQNVGFPAAAPPTLTLATNNVTFTAAGTISNTGNLVINSTGNLTFTGVTAGAFGAPVSVTVNALGNVTIPTELLNGGTETSTTLISSGTLTLPVNSITVAPAGGTGNGGTIFISSKLQNFVTGVSGPLALSAMGGATAGPNNGGTITYNSTGGANIDISSPAGTITANVSAGTIGAGTTGGTFNSTTKGTITLDNGLTNSATVNNNIFLDSTGAGVVVTALATGVGGSVTNIGQGNLTLDSNSASAFAVVQALPVGTFKNGMVAVNPVTVGTFTINNLGGGVSFGQLITANPVALPAGFAAIVEAKGNITDALGKAVVAGPSIELASSAGNIGSVTMGKVVGVPFIIDGTNAPATNVSITVGKSGVANVQDSSVNNDILVSPTAGATYDFTSGGSIQTLAPITAGNVTLTAGGAVGNIALGGTLGNGSGIVSLNGPATGTLSQSQGTIAAKTFSFNVGTMTTPIYTTASAIGVGSTVTAAAGNPTINIVDTSTKGLTLPALVTQNAPGTILITSAGNIVVTGNIGQPNLAQTVSLIATGKGTITESAGVTIEATNLLTLEGANIAGTGKNAAIQVNTGPTGGLLQLSSPGAIAINDTSTLPVTVQSIPGTVASFTLTSAGPIILNNISATGLIQVTDASGGRCRRYHDQCRHSACQRQADQLDLDQHYGWKWGNQRQWQCPCSDSQHHQRCRCQYQYERHSWGRQCRGQSQRQHGQHYPDRLICRRHGRRCVADIYREYHTR
jgi:hypothetical protein